MKDNSTILTTDGDFNTNDVFGCSGIVGDGTANATAWVTSTANLTLIERTSTVSKAGPTISVITPTYSCLELSKENITFYYEDRTSDFNILNNHTTTISLNFSITNPIDYEHSAKEYLFFSDELLESLEKDKKVRIKLTVNKTAFETNETLKANLNIITDVCKDETIPIFVFMERKPWIIPKLPELPAEYVDTAKYIFYGILLSIIFVILLVWLMKKEINFVSYIFGLILFAITAYGIYNFDQTIFKDMSLYLSILINTLIVVTLLIVYKFIVNSIKKPIRKIY